MKKAICSLYALANISWAAYFLHVQWPTLLLTTPLVCIPVVIISLSLIVLTLLMASPGIKRIFTSLYALGNISWAACFLYRQQKVLNLTNLTVLVPVLIIVFSLIVLTLLMIRPHTIVLTKKAKQDKKKGSSFMKRAMYYLFSLAIFATGAIGLYHCRAMLLVTEPFMWIALALIVVGLICFQNVLLNTNIGKTVKNESASEEAEIEQTTPIRRRRRAVQPEIINEDEYDDSWFPAETPETKENTDELLKTIQLLNQRLEQLTNTQKNLYDEIDILKENIANLEAKNKKTTRNSSTRKTATTPKTEVNREAYCYPTLPSVNSDIATTNTPRRRRRNA